MYQIVAALGVVSFGFSSLYMSGRVNYMNFIKTKQLNNGMITMKSGYAEPLKNVRISRLGINILKQSKIRINEEDYIINNTICDPSNTNKQLEKINLVEDIPYTLEYEVWETNRNTKLYYLTRNNTQTNIPEIEFITDDINKLTEYVNDTYFESYNIVLYMAFLTGGSALALLQESQPF